MSIPLKWAPGDKAVVRVTVRGVDTVGRPKAIVELPTLVSMMPAHVQVSVADLEIPPLVADDPHVVELVTVARDILADLESLHMSAPRLRLALAALEARRG